jgi:pentatricopeptide repeat protein
VSTLHNQKLNYVFDLIKNISHLYVAIPSNEAIIASLESNIKEASSLIQQRADANQPVTTIVYSKLFKSLGKAFHLTKIEHFFNQMLSHNVPRDVVVYHQILYGISNCLPDPDINHEVGTFLEKLYESLTKETDFNPQISTFNLFVNCAILSENTDFVLFLIEEMKNRSINHDKTTCNLLIKFYEKDTDNMMRIWDMMREKKFSPSSRSYSIIIGNF